MCSVSKRPAIAFRISRSFGKLSHLAAQQAEQVIKSGASLHSQKWPLYFDSNWYNSANEMFRDVPLLLLFRVQPVVAHCIIARSMAIMLMQCPYLAGAHFYFINQ